MGYSSLINTICQCWFSTPLIRNVTTGNRFRIALSWQPEVWHETPNPRRFGPGKPATIFHFRWVHGCFYSLVSTRLSHRFLYTRLGSESYKHYLLRDLRSTHPPGQISNVKYKMNLYFWPQRAPGSGKNSLRAVMGIAVQSGTSLKKTITMYSYYVVGQMKALFIRICFTVETCIKRKKCSYLFLDLYIQTPHSSKI